MDVKLSSTGAGATKPAPTPATIRQAERAVPAQGPGPARGAPARTDAGHRADRTGGTAPGPERVLHESMGRVDLPPPLELMAALEAAREFAPMADRAVPGLGQLVGAVIDDERHKLARMLDLGR